MQGYSNNLLAKSISIPNNKTHFVNDIIVFRVLLNDASANSITGCLFFLFNGSQLTIIKKSCESCTTISLLLFNQLCRAILVSKSVTIM